MQLTSIFQRIDDLKDKIPRLLIAIAGPPTAGKSTISETLLDHYGDEMVILPMDGFHLDNDVLDLRSLRHKKGAPETFDANGFVDVIERVADGQNVFVPKFDRERDLARAGAIEIKSQQIVLVEGNYLFLDRDPWRRLLPFWHLRIWLDVPLETVRERSVKRWLSYGFNTEESQMKADQNDVKNAEFLAQNIAHVEGLLII